MAEQDPPTSQKKFLPGDPEARPFATNIDRRQCTRTVPLKLIAVGLSRTGTCSTTQALVDLGYYDCYHMTSILNQNPRDADMWVAALKAKFEGKGKVFERSDWDQLLGHCMAVTDTPSIVFWKDLMAAYPEAQVLLTIRDSSEAWFKSSMSTVQPYAAKIYPGKPTLWQRIRQMVLPASGIDQMFTLLMKYHPLFQYGQYDVENGTSTSKKMYEDWNADVIRSVPKDRLLVFNVKQGWEPLCKFLDKPVPKEPFPRLNDGDSWRNFNEDFPAVLDKVALTILSKYVGLALVACGGATYFWFR